MHATSTIATYGILPPWLNAPDGVSYTPTQPSSAVLEEVAEGALAGLYMLAPHGTLERRYTMAQGLRALAVGAPFTILAPNDRGGTRLAKELTALGCTVEATAKHHHRLCHGLRPATLTLDSAIAEGSPCYDETIGFWTQPGVFSWNRIDPASALLVKHLPRLHGQGADFGCGFGYLARAVLASSAVTHLTLVDIDRRAIAMARKNITARHATLQWADATCITLPSLDFIVMNPPFHEAGQEERALGQAFLRNAAANLKRGGTCWLVANRHLPYEAVLAEHFTCHRLVAEADGFKLYEATR